MGDAFWRFPSLAGRRNFNRLAGLETRGRGEERGMGLNAEVAGGVHEEERRGFVSTWRDITSTEFDGEIFALAVPALGSLIIEPGVRCVCVCWNAQVYVGMHVRMYVYERHH